MKRNISVSIFLLFSVFYFSPLFAQSDQQGVVTNTYYLSNTNATIEPGNLQKGVSVIIKDGIIQAIGKHLSVPYDAQVIKGDSLYIYAAFIDALSYTAVPKKEDQNIKGKKIIPGLATNKEAGITPELNVITLINENDKSIENMRSSGFAIAHIVPRGNMMTGQGALILLSGKDKMDIVLKQNVSIFSQFVSSKKMYPSTILGIMAKWRQLYRQSAYGLLHNKAYNMNPQKGQRPKYSEAVVSLYPVVEEKIPVFFNTPSHLDISRALSLQKDLDFRIVLSEVKQGNHYINIIKKAQIPVILSLDLPKKSKEKKDKKKNNLDTISKQNIELIALQKRKNTSIEEYESQAALFEKNNIPFSFSFLESKPTKMMENLKRMREKGLSDQGALAALTTNPAALHGISDIVGTLKKGKIANIVVYTKPLFDDKSKLKYIFIEGNKFEFDTSKKKKKKASGDNKKLDIAGTWSYEIELPGVEPSGKLIIEKIDDNYMITLTNDQDENDEPEIIEDVQVNENSITFSFEIDGGGNVMDIEIEIDFDVDSFDGNVTVGEMGTFPISGERLEKPKY